MPQDHEVFLYRCPNCKTVIAPGGTIDREDNWCPACDKSVRFEPVYVSPNPVPFRFMVKKDD